MTRRNYFFCFCLMSFFLLNGCAELGSDFPERRNVPAHAPQNLRPIAPLYSEIFTQC